MYSIPAIEFKVKKLHPDAILPTKERDSDSGWDLYALETVSLMPYGTIRIPTGIAIELPEGYDAEIRPRSGNALKRCLTVLNSPGTVDNEYRGDVSVIMTWIPPLGTVLWDSQIDPYMTINKGDKIAQMVITPVISSSFDVVDELSITDRGEKGFGSSGQ